MNIITQSLRDAEEVYNQNEHLKVNEKSVEKNKNYNYQYQQKVVDFCDNIQTKTLLIPKVEADDIDNQTIETMKSWTLSN